MDNLSNQLLALAIEAGRRALRFYKQARTDSVKADASPLTAADLASHEFLVASLAPLLPGVPVISEESPDALTQELPSRFWLVDPLDGTKEFIKGTGEFTVNIALVQDGKSVLGVVHAPVLGTSYAGIQGAGAWRIRESQRPERIACRPWNPARVALVASKEHAGPLTQQLVERLPGATLRSMGSSLKFCLVAEGSADLYLRDLPTMEWDTAAAQCVVEAAGGKVFNLEATPLPYGKAGLKNPAIITVGDPSCDWQKLVADRPASSHTLLS